MRAPRRASARRSAPRLRDDHRVAQRRAQQAVVGDDRGLLADHALAREPRVGVAVDEQRVDVRVGAAARVQDLEPHEVRLVRVVPAMLRDEASLAGVVVARAVESARRVADAMKRQVRRDALPPRPVRRVAQVHVDRLGRLGPPARLEREPVREVERLVLRAQAEDEVKFSPHQASASTNIFATIGSA
jgi:hypothetical protein